MIDNSTYNKIKLFHQLCELIWFIEKHAVADAKSAGDDHCVTILNALKADLEKNLEQLKKGVGCCSKVFACNCGNCNAK